MFVRPSMVVGMSSRHYRWYLMQTLLQTVLGSSTCFLKHAFLDKYMKLQVCETLVHKKDNRDIGLDEYPERNPHK